VIAELLRYPLGAAALAECLESPGDGLPDLTGAGLVAALQRRHEQGIGTDGADAEVVHRWPHRELLHSYLPLDSIPGVRIFFCSYQAEQSGGLLIPADPRSLRCADPIQG
jgi:hypothetical protein